MDLLRPAKFGNFGVDLTSTGDDIEDNQRHELQRKESEIEDKLDSDSD